MIAHYTVSHILRADDNHRAGPEGATYVCLFAHSLTREPLDQLASSEARSMAGFLKAVAAFRRCGGTALWKGGEIKTANRLFSKRLDELSSGVNTGRVDLPTAEKIHQLITSQGGYALTLMIPVSVYTSEKKMMRDFIVAHGMTFDNYGRDANVTGPIKKRKLKSRPMNFAL